MPGRNSCGRSGRHVFRPLFSVLIVCIFVLIFFVQAEAKNFLWSVRSESNTVYLLGSIHILRSESYPLPEVIEKAFDSCDRVVFETDLEGFNSPELQAKMLALGLYLDGGTLQQSVSEETYELLENRIARVGLPMAQFLNFKPWLCALTLTVIELQRLGFSPEYGIDRHFFDKARQQKKKLIFLEPVEFQLNLLGEMDESDQESFLLQTLKDLETIETMARDMMRFWESGDSDNLDSLLKKSFKDFPDIYERILTDRNIEWIARIEELMRQRGNAIVIVGAGHLTGVDGVLDLLEQRGYEIEQR